MAGSSPPERSSRRGRAAQRGCGSSASLPWCGETRAAPELTFVGPSRQPAACRTRSVRRAGDESRGVACAGSAGCTRRPPAARIAAREAAAPQPGPPVCCRPGLQQTSRPGLQRPVRRVLGSPAGGLGDAARAVRALAGQAVPPRRATHSPAAQRAGAFQLPADGLQGLKWYMGHV